MNENYIVINGKKIELTEEQLKQLGIESEKKNPFERLDKYDCYYYITEYGNVDDHAEEGDCSDQALYDGVNYFNNKDFAEQVALHQLLYRKLLKFSYDNECEDDKWNNLNYHWHIFYNHIDDCFDVQGNNGFKFQSVHFKSQVCAERAIKEVVEPFMKEHPDFVW